jgi:hypothetical protein
MSQKMNVQRRLEESRAVRYVEEPTSVPIFRSVTRLWHFPSGDVLLEREARRDCLLRHVERIDVPASEVEAVADALAIETDTAVRVGAEPDGLVIREFDTNIQI